MRAIVYGFDRKGFELYLVFYSVPCTRSNIRCVCTSPEKRRRRLSRLSKSSIRTVRGPFPSEYIWGEIVIRPDFEEFGPNPSGRRAAANCKWNWQGWQRIHWLWWISVAGGSEDHCEQKLTGLPWGLQSYRRLWWWTDQQGGTSKSQLYQQGKPLRTRTGPDSFLRGISLRREVQLQQRSQNALSHSQSMIFLNIFDHPTQISTDINFFLRKLLLGVESRKKDIINVWNVAKWWLRW